MKGRRTPDDDLDKNWDLVVLGAGTAGLVTARIAANLGAHVLAATVCGPAAFRRRR